MSAYLTGFVGLIYCVVAVTEWKANRHGFSLMFIAYAMANVGIIWSMYE
jgi:hypothetical protein